MSAPRRRLSPDDRRSELLALGAEVFGQRPYDEVRIDEIAERAGVSRALMYHYFPDKRAFFAAVVRAEGERLFEATNTAPEPGQSLFDHTIWVIASEMSNGLHATSPASATCCAANGWTSSSAWYARRRRVALRTAWGPNRAPGR